MPARPDSDPVEVRRLLLPLSRDGIHVDMLPGGVYLLPADAAVKRA